MFSYNVDEKNATENSVHHWVMEASDLRLPPGQFPRQLRTTLGNRRPFYMTTLKGDYADYQQDLGCLRLRVFND